MRLAGRDRELLVEGIDRFNRGRFWDAHESWETIWLESSDPMKRFLQGLIQLAAAYHHFRRGTLGGGIRLVDAAEQKLDGFPPRYLGVDREAAVAQARLDRSWAAEQSGEKAEGPLPLERFPQLELANEDGPEE